MFALHASFIIRDYCMTHKKIRAQYIQRVRVHFIIFYTSLLLILADFLRLTPPLPFSFHENFCEKRDTQYSFNKSGLRGIQIYKSFVVYDDGNLIKKAEDLILCALRWYFNVKQQCSKKKKFAQTNIKKRFNGNFSCHAKSKSKS